MKFKITLLGLLFSTLIFAQGLEPTDTEALLKVNVQTVDGSPAPSQYVTFTVKGSDQVYSGASDDSGRFEILIPEGKTFVVQVDGFAGAENTSEFEIPEMEQLIVMNYTIVTEKTASNQLDVEFETGSAELKPNSYKAIDELYNWMKDKTNIKIEIGGHTDNVGSDASNQTLSQSRAESVRKYMVDKGIDADRILAKGYGESKPIATNDTSEGRQKNRRTEVRIIANN